ncbi:hypothetical protein AZI86_01770 [Bdellovibrio bacteriovorus]|uniref:RNA-binding protein KhpA n=1 Tax=Bdellovibrio bacteriovorus TaxID=959 RepID=A0A150WNE0_BDEBC|nr:KH domain-containing protein [Bdellovibrio bacteriovorus]KYG65827.1 hypothetical protein AZI86_01770 [Bdellovibrio bacteriovorus]
MEDRKVEVIRKKSPPRNCSKQRKAEVSLEIRDLISLILKKILQHPDKLNVIIEEGPDTVVYDVDFDPSDFGRLVGSKGKHISALRVIVLTISATQGFRAIVRIKDEERFY